MVLLEKNNIIVTTLLCLVAFTLPFGFVKNINSISIILLSIYAIYISITQKKIVINKSALQVLPIVYFVFLVFSLTYSEHIYQGVKQIEKNLSFLLFPLIFWRLDKFITQTTKDRILLSFVISNIIALLICIFYATMVYYQKSDINLLIKGSFYFTEILDIHPTYFSMYLVLCICVLRTYLYNTKLKLNMVRKIITIVIMIFLLVSILHLRSRSAILGLILIGVVLMCKRMIYMYKSNQKVFLGMLLGGILLFFFLLFSTSVKNNLLEYAQGYLKRDTSWALEERLDGWSASLEAVSESYIFGYGIGDSQKVRDKYFYIHGFDVGIDNEYNSHNQYIEILIIGGIFGLILFLSMYFKLILLYLKTFNTNILCFFLLLFVVMITESILVRQHGIVFFSFFYMLFNIRIDEKKG